MEYNNITKTARKNKHLNDFERDQTQLLNNKEYFACKIGKALNRTYYN